MAGGVNVVQALLITLGMDTSGVKKGMGDAESRIKGGMGNIVRSLIAPIAAAASFGALLNNYVQSGDQLYKLSQKLKMGAEDIQAWGNAVESAGGDASAMQNSLNGIEEKLKNVRLGRWSGEFMMMGINVRNANGQIKNAGEIMGDLSRVADRMDPRRFEFFARRFGLDDGTIRMMQKGSAEVEKLTSKYRALALTQRDTETARKFKIAMGDLTKSIQAGFAVIMRATLPALEKFIRGFESVVNFIRRHERFVKVALIGIATAITANLIPAIIKFTAAMLANPIFLIIAAVIALSLAIEDLIGFSEGADSAFGRLLKTLGASEYTINETRKLIKDLFDTSLDWENILDKISMGFEGLTGRIQKFIFRVGLGEEATNKLKESQEQLWEKISEIWNKIWDKVKFVVDKIKELYNSIPFFGDEEVEITTPEGTKKTVPRPPNLPSLAIPEFARPTNSAQSLPRFTVPAFSTMSNQTTETHFGDINFNIVSSDPRLASQEVDAVMRNIIVSTSNVGTNQGF